MQLAERPMLVGGRLLRAEPLGWHVAPLLRDVRRGGAPEGERSVPPRERDPLRGRPQGGVLEERDRQHEPRLAALHRRGHQGLRNARWGRGRGVRLRQGSGPLAGRGAPRHPQSAADGRAVRRTDAGAEPSAVSLADAHVGADGPRVPGQPRGLLPDDARQAGRRPRPRVEIPRQSP